jgi:hypothetical protein
MGFQVTRLNRPAPADPGRAGEIALQASVSFESNAAKNHNREELAWEASDLLFHLLLVMAEQGLPPAELGRVLLERHKPAGNP